MKKFKYKRVYGKNFIKNFSKNDKLVLRFLKNWIYTRKIPETVFESTIKNKTTEILINYGAADFVFPLKIEIKRRGCSSITLIVKKESSTLR